MSITWDELLEHLISEDSFKNQIQNQGFYLNKISYQAMIKKYNFEHSATAASFLSLDFFSKQSKTLTKNGLYLIRTGKGNFAILDKEKFPHSYLQLELKNPTEIKVNTNEFPEMFDAFKARQENAGLEQLNAMNGYQKLIFELFGKTEWRIGPRGIQGSVFPVFFKNKNNHVEKIFKFDGRDDLDYSIWTKDHILAIEAKSLPENQGLDIGWHKIVYPTNRFSKYKNYKIKPVYFLRWGKIIHIFVFPTLSFYEGGILLNDQNAFKPDRVFKIETGLG